MRTTIADDSEMLRDVHRVRAEIRAGRITGTSRGLALGFVQCNLVILPADFLSDFLRYCELNRRACPVLEVGQPGDPVPHKLAPSADLRTDVSRYAVWVNGVRQEDYTDITSLWRDDLVFALIGSGITFDAALLRAGIQTDRYRWVLNTTQPTIPAGRFCGPLVVTMRWMTPAEADLAAQITSRYPAYHGAPIHIGEPSEIGADIEQPLFGGPVPERPKGLVAVFWACGVTPQAAAEQARLPLMIAHAPAHSFITDVPAGDLLGS